MNSLWHRKMPCRTPTIVHNMVCQHQIEIEVWPTKTEVYFRDEPHVDPISTQVRFDALVYNAPTANVTWKVKSAGGGPGAGTVDPSGLYIAPPKGSLVHGYTDIIVATAVDDPMRKAYGRVALIGFGPELPPQPCIEIFPKQLSLYYPENFHNNYIDFSNTLQIFRTLINHSPSGEVEWFVDSIPVAAWNKPWYQYRVTGHGSNKMVIIRACLKNYTSIKDEAVVNQINYTWPGLY